MNLIINKFKIGVIILAFTSAISLGYYLYNKGSEAKEQEIIVKQQETYIETRRRIDEATGGDRSVSDAVDRLRSRQEQRNK